MNNHLIIGLGGSGGKIIRALRKTIFQEFRGHQPIHQDKNGKQNQNVTVEYLYIDSDTRMMELDNPSWKILGNSVQLSESQKLEIKGSSDIKKRIEHRNDYPGIKDWIGDKEQWTQIIGGITGQVLGGQKRRLGRFLFSQKVDDFNSKINSLVNKLQENGTIHITFHICCGLAGGTGSGSIIDVLTQIRNAYPDTDEYRIIVYTLLPDTKPPEDPKWNTGNYHANGYAALMELNALSLGKWKPHDITGKSSRITVNNPFSGCYLFFNENENKLKVDVDKDIPSIVADFIYQKLIAVHGVDWQELGRMEDAENFNGSAESNPDSEVLERSKGFFTFGIKRLVIPEEEIREYITYSFAKQASRQMIYNNWSDSIGFANEAKKISYHEEAKKEENWERWLITNDHLCLSKGILGDERANKKWKRITQEWEDFINNRKMNVRKSPKMTWLSEIKKLCQEHFEERFRGQGVQDFYKEKKEYDKDKHIAEIRARIENELFESWKEGNKSFHEINYLIDAIVDVLEKRHEQVSDVLVKLNDKRKAADKKITANETEWANIGELSAIFRKRDKSLEAQALCLQVKYTCLTQIEAWTFAENLLSGLILNITDLRNEVRKYMSLMLEVLKQFEINVDERCIENNQHTDLKKSVIWFYEPSMVKNFTQFLIKDNKIQKDHANNIREDLISILGDNPTSSSFNARLLKQTIFDVVTKKSQQNAENAHDLLIARDKDKAKQFNVNIIEKLARKFSGDPSGLNKYMLTLIKQAGNYLVFNNEETQKQAAGSSEDIRAKHFAIIIPKEPSLEPFIQQLVEILKGCCPVAPTIIYNDSNCREIVFINITNLFPLRYVKQVEFLKEEYDKRIADVLSKEGSDLTLELHLEGDGSIFPPLFLLSEKDREQKKRETLLHEQAFAWLLLAFALEVIIERVNPVTGKTEILLTPLDEDGLDEHVRLGASLVDIIENRINLEQIESIKNEVEARLSDKFLHVDNQAILKKQVMDLVNTIKLEYSDFMHPIYTSANNAAKIVINILKNIGG